MTDKRYRPAAGGALLGEAAQAVMARVRASGQLRQGLSVATMARALPQLVPMPASTKGDAGNRPPLPGGRTPAIVPARSTLRAAVAGLRAGLPGRAADRVAATPPPVMMRAMSARLAKSVVAGAATGLDARVVPSGAKLTGPRIVMAAGKVPAMTGVRAGLAHAAHPARRLVAAQQAAHRRPAVGIAGAVPRLQPAVAGTTPPAAEVPGFRHTVRQAQATARHGDVYLDRELVGYHLAAAITAEQTRAAGRPNISGSGFNSSMAVLRPSGAGS